GETFEVALALRDADGYALSANHYALLIGDQEAARVACRERAERLQAIKRGFGTADYYRFYPELSGEDRARRVGDDPPKAAGLLSEIPDGDPEH
ncbi:hypothetical protein CMK11_02485, partial [Candidatus Poribacteria bacterium]|nr:hypothetical protein [Candidatus Poribacteria bacterium]